MCRSIHNRRDFVDVGRAALLVPWPETNRPTGAMGTFTLEAVTQVAPHHRTVGGGRAGGEAAPGVQHIMDSNLGDQRHRQFPLRPTGSGHDIPDTGTKVRRARTVVVGTLGLRFHGGQGRRMLEREVTDGRELHVTDAKGSQTWRMRGRGERRMVGGGRQGIVGEGGRRWGGRVGRAGA